MRRRGRCRADDGLTLIVTVIVRTSGGRGELWEPSRWERGRKGLSIRAIGFVWIEHRGGEEEGEVGG